MSAPMTAGPAPATVEHPRGPRAALWHPVATGCVSAVLLWLAFPPVGWSPLAWIALVPLFLLVQRPGRPTALYLGAWAGGMTYWMLSISWVSLTDESAWLAWVVMAFALSLWWLGFLVLGRLAVVRLGVPLMLAAPVLWVGLEYLRAHVLSGFPWYYLAHSQHQVLPIIQIADLTGALGVSLLIALFNAWCVDLLTTPLLRPTPEGARLARPQIVRASVVGALLVATLAYGTVRILTANFRPGPRVALLQSSIVQRIKMAGDPRDVEEIYRKLINRAVSQEPRPDLVIWPETAYPYFPVGMVDPKLDSASFERQFRTLDLKGTAREYREHMDLLLSHLHGWTDEVQVPMLVGSVFRVFEPEGHFRYNSALLFEPGKLPVQSYHKLHLVPFGEYVPLIDYLPWLTALTPYNGSHVPSLSFGREPKSIDLGPYRIAVAICFEDTVPHVVRRFFHEARGGRQPDVLLNLSNDGWFHGSSEHDMHLAVSIFRAIENRVPLARAVNTGVSALVDGNGRVHKSLPKLQEGVLSGQLLLDGRTTLYSAWGDWLGVACLTAALGVAPFALVRSLLRPRPR